MVNNIFDITIKKLTEYKYQFCQNINSQMNISKQNIKVTKKSNNTI